MHRILIWLIKKDFNMNLKRKIGAMYLCQCEVNFVSIYIVVIKN
jgi:hypothetical protein